MSKILIIEDEKFICDEFVRIAGEVDSLIEITWTESASNAIEIAENEEVDAFFIEIELKEISGYELARKIRQIDRYKFTPVIIISDIYVIDIDMLREIHCYDYITKPFSEDEIIRAFNDIVKFADKTEKTKPVIAIKEKRYTYVFNQDDLVYIEARNRKLFIKTIYEELYISSQTLVRFSQNLTDVFIQCHKGFIVNSAFISKIDRLNNIIHMLNSSELIPIGRKFKENLKGLF